MISPSGPSNSRVLFTSSAFFLHAFATIGRAVGNGQLELLVAELDVLLDVVSRAVGRDPRLGFPAQELVDRHVQRFADQIPQGDVDTADGVDDHAFSPVVHRRAPQDVPDPFDVERVFVQQQFGQVLFYDEPAARAAAAVTLQSLVRPDLDGESSQLAGIRLEQ